MKRSLLLLPLLIALAGCKEEAANLPAPVEMNAESVGFYCQMNLLEHDGPKGQIHLDGAPAPLFFSQVRDAVAYLHMPEQSHAVKATYVQDMTGATWAAPGPWIEVSRAYYVIGSDATGGMGAPEFVPFSERQAAADFARTHGGTVREFSEIAPEEALAAAKTPAETDGPDGDMSKRLNALKHYGN